MLDIEARQRTRDIYRGLNDGSFRPDYKAMAVELSRTEPREFKAPQAREYLYAKWAVEIDEMAKMINAQSSPEALTRDIQLSLASNKLQKLTGAPSYEVDALVGNEIIKYAKKYKSSKLASRPQPDEPNADDELLVDLTNWINRGSSEVALPDISLQPGLTFERLVEGMGTFWIIGGDITNHYLRQNPGSKLNMRPAIIGASLSVPLLESDELALRIFDAKIITPKNPKSPFTIRNVVKPGYFEIKPSRAGYRLPNNEFTTSGANPSIGVNKEIDQPQKLSVCPVTRSLGYLPTATPETTTTPTKQTDDDHPIAHIGCPFSFAKPNSQQLISDRLTTAVSAMLQFEPTLS